MTFKLMQSAQKRWIKLRGFHHLDSVMKEIKFINGKLEENIGANFVATNSQHRIAA